MTMPPDGADPAARLGGVQPASNPGIARDELRATADALEAATDGLLGADDPPVRDILGAYYLAISAKAAVAASRGTDVGDAARRCEDAVGRFDRTLHPKMEGYLSRAVRERSDALLAQGRGEAGAYSELRSMMSVREFVGQYGSI